MKRKLSSLLLISTLVFCLNTYSQVSPGWQWVKSAGGTGLDEAELPAVDPAGNIFFCGKFSDTAWFDQSYIVSGGGRDPYIAKYDNNGNMFWVKQGICPNNSDAVSISSDKNGNAAITGHFMGQLAFDTATLPGDPSKNSAFLAVFDPSGSLLWAVNSTGGYARGKGVMFDKDGNVYITGYFEDTVTFGQHAVISPGERNAFLAKYDPNGICLWATEGGSHSRAWASSVDIDSYGNAYITGAFIDTAHFGSNSIISNGGNDIFLAKCSPTGTWIWAVNAGGVNDDFGNGIEVDVFDHIAVTGSFFNSATFDTIPTITGYGDRDGFVAYFNPDGNCLWVQPFGGSSQDKGIGVSTDNAGNIYVAGFINGIGNFGPIQKTSVGNDDVSIAKYSRNGTIQWAALAGGSSDDISKGIRVAKQGVAYVTGHYRETASFGSHTVTSNGHREAFLAKYYDGTPIITKQPLSQTLCINDTLMLSIDIQDTAGVSYSWHKNGNHLPGYTTNQLMKICHDTLITGKYVCIAQSINGYVISDTAFINVYPLPVSDLPSDTIHYMGSFLTLDAGAGHANYLWSTGDTTQSISYFGEDIVMMIFSGSFSGTIYVTITSDHGCVTIDSTQITITNHIETINAENFNIVLSPNPAQDKISISSDVQINQIEIVSTIGKIVFNKEIHPAENITINLPDNLRKGLYIVIIHTDHGTLSKKLILNL